MKLDPSDLLNASDAARLRGCHRNLIRKATLDGRLKPVNVSGTPHYRRADVLALAFNPNGRKPKGKP